MDHADVDHDGKIDCDEFSAWATGKKTLFHGLDLPPTEKSIPR